MPADATARVAYDGPGVVDGSMDVRQLGPALIAIGELLQEANRELNGDRATLSVRVQSDFRSGSFEIDFGLTTLVASQLAMSFGPESIKSAKHIAEYVGLIVGEKPSLLTLLRWLRGRRPTAAKEEKDEESVVVHVHGDNHTIVVHRNVYQLAQSQLVREAAAETLRPLKEGVVDRFEIRDANHVVRDVIERDDLQSFSVPTSEIPVASDSEGDNVREQLVEVVKPSFEPGLRWVLSDGSGGRFGAVMKDSEFRARVESGLRTFAKGDVLRVEVRSTPHLTAEGLRTDHEVLRVIEEFNAPRQARLLPDPS